MKIKTTLTPKCKLFFAPLLLMIFLFTSCTDCSTCVQGTELWEGKYVKGIVHNQATVSSNNGLIEVNIVNDFDANRFLVVYTHDPYSSIYLNDTVYLQASEYRGIAMASNISRQVPAEVYAGEAKTSMNEHNSFDHAFSQHLHRKGHMVLKDGNLIVTGGYLGVNEIVIDPATPLYDKASEIYSTPQDGSSNSEVEIFFEFDENDVNLIDVDPCHKHNGRVQGCIN